MAGTVPGKRVRRAAAWDEPVTAVRFVDTPRAELLGKLGIATVEDLLRHYPARYLDLRTSAPLASLPLGMEVTAVGQVHEVTVKRPRPRLSITEVAITDGSGVVVGVWFNQSYLAQRFRVGERVAFAGRVQMEFGLRQMRNPFVERLGYRLVATSAKRAGDPLQAELGALEVLQHVRGKEDVQQAHLLGIREAVARDG